MIEWARLAIDTLFGVADSDRRWFILSCFWLAVSLSLVAYGIRQFRHHYESRIKALETSQSKCDEALELCRKESERRDYIIDIQDRQITAQNSGYAVLRGYMMARGMMDPNADTLILAEMNQLVKDKKELPK